MEKLKGLAIELDMDHLAVDRGLKGLKDNLRTVNSEMKRNMSAFDFGEKSVKKYETSLSGLNKKLEVQKVAVAEAKKEYEAMVKEHGHGSKEAERAAREYNNQAAALNNLERYIENTKKELAEFEKQQRIANSGWTKFGNKLESYGGKLKGIGNQMSDVGSQMTNKITKPALIAGGAVGGMVAAFGWKRLTSLDAAQAQLKGLGYNTKEVGRISEQVTTAIDGGMTTMAEGTAVAAGALAAGVKEGKELERYIKLVGDAAVGANRPVNEMAMIFNRVQGSGKLMTQELNSIEDGMPGFSKAMAKHLGVSTEEFRKMVTAGKVSSKDFLNVMDDFAGGMASAYAESWDGMVANTKAYIGIIGENFLRGVFQDSKKSLADFIELLKSPEVQQRAEEMGEKAQVAFNKMKDSIMGVVEWYINLDDGQKKIVHSLGLVAIAGGPVLQFTGKLTTGLGHVFEATSKVSKAIGVARGAGLVAGLASLGPAGVAGVAVVGLGAVVASLYKLHGTTKDVEEANLDVAESLSEEAVALEKAAKTFDKLSGKAKVSNEQLAELHDLNQRISQSANPGEIEQLQKQFDALAKKSGLSKEEIEKLFTANDTLIKQSPDVQKSVSDTGNEFVTSTEKVREYISSLLEASRVELEAEREQQLQRQNELTDELIKKERQLGDMQEALAYADELRGKSKEELLELDAQLTEQMNEAKAGSEEWLALDEKRTALNEAMNGNAEDYYFILLDSIKEKRESLNLTKEELAELEQQTQALADVYLQQVGITEQGEKGLAQLDKAIAKNDEELAKLEEKKQKNGELSEKEQERYDYLSETTEKQREHRDIIHDELGLYKDLNSLAEAKMEKVDKTTQKNIENLAKTTDIKVEEGNIIKQLETQNSEIDKTISKLEKEHEAGKLTTKEYNNQIKEQQKKKQWNDAIIEQVLKELGVWDQVKDSIQDGTEKEKKKGQATDETTNKSKKQGDQIDNNNKKTDAGIKKEKERTKEAGRDADKNVNATDNGTVAKIDAKAVAEKTKDVALRALGLGDLNRAASEPVTKTVNVVPNMIGKMKSIARGYEKGTPPSGHPGGDFIAGEKGEELTILPSGLSFLTPKTATLFPDMPRGTHVIPHRETKQILRGIPGYAEGTPNFGNSEFARLLMANSQSESSVTVSGSSGKNNSDSYLNKLLQATLEQNKLLMQLLKKDTKVIIDPDGLYDDFDNRLTNDSDLEKYMRGAR